MLSLSDSDLNLDDTGLIDLRELKKFAYDELLKSAFRDTDSLALQKLMYKREEEEQNAVDMEVDHEGAISEYGEEEEMMTEETLLRLVQQLEKSSIIDSVSMQETLQAYYDNEMLNQDTNDPAPFHDEASPSVPLSPEEFYADVGQTYIQYMDKMLKSYKRPQNPRESGEYWKTSLVENTFMEKCNKLNFLPIAKLLLNSKGELGKILVKYRIRLRQLVYIREKSRTIPRVVQKEVCNTIIDLMIACFEDMAKEFIAVYSGRVTANDKKVDIAEQSRTTFKIPAKGRDDHRKMLNLQTNFGMAKGSIAAIAMICEFEVEKLFMFEKDVRDGTLLFGFEKKKAFLLDKVTEIPKQMTFPFFVDCLLERIEELTNAWIAGREDQYNGLAAKDQQNVDNSIVAAQKRKVDQHLNKFSTTIGASSLHSRRQKTNEGFHIRTSDITAATFDKSSSWREFMQNWLERTITAKGTKLQGTRKTIQEITENPKESLKRILSKFLKETRPPRGEQIKVKDWLSAPETSELSELKELFFHLALLRIQEVEPGFRKSRFIEGMESAYAQLPSQIDPFYSRQSVRIRQRSKFLASAKKASIRERYKELDDSSEDELPPFKEWTRAKASELFEAGVIQVEMEAARYAQYLNDDKDELDMQDEWDTYIAPLTGPFFDIRDSLSGAVENTMKALAPTQIQLRRIFEDKAEALVREFDEAASDLIDHFAHDVIDSGGKNATALFKRAFDECIADYTKMLDSIWQLSEKVRPE